MGYDKIPRQKLSITKKNKKTLVLQDIAKMLTIVKGETKKSSK